MTKGHAMQLQIFDPARPLVSGRNVRHWTDREIHWRLRRVVSDLGRMPSSSELRGLGLQGLASAVSRCGGYHKWSLRLGVEQKGTETHFAQRWERHEVGFFESLGFDVERQTTKAPFDMMVNGHRVDVKAAHFGVYQNNRSGGYCSGFIFSGLKRGKCADFFDLLCIDGGEVVHRLIVPAPEARIVTLTVTPRTLAGRGKYSRFMGADAVDALAVTRAPVPRVEHVGRGAYRATPHAGSE